VKRRSFLLGPLALIAKAAGAAIDYPMVRPGLALAFPRDHGSHPAYRNEWWYITGRLKSKAGNELGMQITFFRNRPGIGEDNPSRFAPRQLLFAHAAISDRSVGRLMHDQRAARAGFGLAAAGELDTDVHVGDWTLVHKGDTFVARISGREIGFALDFRPTQPLLVHGEGGVSSKGPKPGLASNYYSLPHLAVSGSITVKDRTLEILGSAWMDHEWSSEALAPEAGGWDWAGLNLADGAALMAFRIRTREGGVFWAGGTHRSADGRVRVLRPDEVAFEPTRQWRSPRTRAEYPVAMRLRAGALDLMLEPSMDDQELDSRASTGTIYWEGAVRAMSGGDPLGQGYLELTGYWKPLKL
jgi:predicted secreted hydrolase